MQEDQTVEEPSDDDTEYYRQEVGEEPDEGWCQILIFGGSDWIVIWIQLIKTALNMVQLSPLPINSVMHPVEKGHSFCQ